MRGCSDHDSVPERGGGVGRDGGRREREERGRQREGGRQKEEGSGSERVTERRGETEIEKERGMREREKDRKEVTVPCKLIIRPCEGHYKEKKNVITFRCRLEANH